MLRTAVDEDEQAQACERLDSARMLMREALAIIDATPVATDCDAHLDQAIHSISDAIAEVEAGSAVFTQSSAVERAAFNGLTPSASLADSTNPWS